MSYMDENWCCGQEGYSTKITSTDVALKTATAEETAEETKEEKDARIAAIVAKNKAEQAVRVAAIKKAAAEQAIKEAARLERLAQCNRDSAARAAAKQSKK